MRNLQVIAKAFVDVYDNMFALLAMNIVWAILAALPVSSLISLLQVVVEAAEPDPTAWVIAALVALLYVLLTGPATYALAVMARRIVDYEAVTLRDFFGAMRAHYRRAWVLGLISLAGTTLLLVNLAFYAGMGGWAVVLVPLFLLITLFWLMMQLYLYPIAVITEGGPLLVLRNAAIVLFRYPGMALLLNIVALILMALSTALLLPWVILTMVLLAALGTRGVRSAVRRDRALPEEDPLDDQPLPPITDEEGRPTLPHYGWRAGRQEAPPDEETSRS